RKGDTSSGRDPGAGSPQRRLGAAGHALRSGRARRRPFLAVRRPLRTAPAGRGVAVDAEAARAGRPRRLPDLLDAVAPQQGAVLGVASSPRAPGRGWAGPAAAAAPAGP